MENTYNDKIENENSSQSKFKLTIFGSTTTPLNKTITLENGKLKKIANGQFNDGIVGLIDCDGLEGYKQILEQNNIEFAYALGRPRHDGKWLNEANITVKGRLPNSDNPDLVARSKEYFGFKKNEPCLFLLDIDGIAGSPEEIREKLCEIDPQLNNVGYMVVHSSSSHVKQAATGETLTGSSGLHIYTLVKNGADIPRYGQALTKRAWLKGYGHIEISKAGSYLVRQIMDASVYSPERLIFEAPATLGEGLIQERPPIQLHDGGLLDTESLPDLTDLELNEYRRLVDNAKALKAPEALGIQEQWVAAKGKEIAEATGCDPVLAKMEAYQLLETDQLPDSYILKFDNHGLVTVADVLSDPKKYDRQTMADPVEPDYNGGRNVAIFYWNNGRPRVHSYAHGRKVYKFASVQTDDVIFGDAVDEAKSNAGAHWKADVIEAAGNLYKDDRAEYQRLRAMLKDNCKNADITKWGKLVIDRGDREKQDDATKLVNMVNVVSETFHDKKNIGYITIDMGDHFETWSLDSTGFLEWLEYFAYNRLDSVPSETTLKSVITALHGQAKHERGDSKEHDVYTRCAPYKDGYLIDLTDDLWRVIHVTPAGWEILETSPVKFIRSQTSTAYPEPDKTGSIDDLWRHVNIPEESRTLVLAFMLDSLRPDSDFPILELTGEHGTAKSSTHTRIRQITDPNSVPLRSAPKDVQDIFVSAGMNWQASFENMSYLPSDMQDGLCTLSTGGGFATRRLYTNAEESVIDVKRPCIINGISAVATRPDLIDRIIHLDLPKLKEYVAKKEMDRRFEDALPRLFGGFLNLFRQTLKQLPHVNINKLPRMGDFALLGQALHVALHDDRAFVDVYNCNKADSLQASLEACPVALAVWELAKDYQYPKKWEGTTMELKDELESSPHDSAGWPQSPRGLGAALRRMGPALREVGVEIESIRKKDGFNLTITFFSDDKKNADQRSPCTPIHPLTGDLKY